LSYIFFNNCDTNNVLMLPHKIFTLILVRLFSGRNFLEYSEELSRGTSRQLTCFLLHLSFRVVAITQTMPPSDLPTLAAGYTTAAPVHPSAPLTARFPSHTVLSARKSRAAGRHLECSFLSHLSAVFREVLTVVNIADSLGTRSALFLQKDPWCSFDGCAICVFTSARIRYVWNFVTIVDVNF